MPRANVVHEIEVDDDWQITLVTRRAIGHARTAELPPEASDDARADLAAAVAGYEDEVRRAGEDEQACLDADRARLGEPAGWRR